MKRRRPEEIGQLLAAQKASGLSVVDFCKKRRIDPGSFYNWRRQHVNDGGKSEFATVARELAEQSQNGNGCRVYLRFENGVELSFTPTLLRTVLKEIRT